MWNGKGAVASDETVEGFVTMYAIDPHVSVKLKFKAMEEPVDVSIPWNVLPYLDLYSDRWISSEGAVVYERPRVKPSARKARRRMTVPA
jgi:hypothetical protein